MYASTSILLAASLARLAVAQYAVADNFTGSGFFNDFTFFTGPDPTNGFVNYVDAGTASSSNLTSINAQGQVYIGVDSTTTLASTTGTGRNSVRISTNKAYTHYLSVLDLAHMPGGVCGTWPAFWSFGSTGNVWPYEGEIDIIEGTNDQTTDYMTLHTSPGCAISGASGGQLQPFSTDCNTAVNANEGCSFHSADTTSYGTGFNNQGGGIYATEWTSDAISIWYWPHSSAPSDVHSGSPNPANWGSPVAQWAGSGCDWDAHFATHNIIFDVTFCGSWAGSDFGSCQSSTGAASCNAFVADNPSAFAQAYWLINSLVVYQNGAASKREESNFVSTLASDMRMGERRKKHAARQVQWAA